MAHFAQLDADNYVIQVIVVNNSELLDENGNESETKGIVFCQSLFGADTRWVQTSYNANFRKFYAGLGYLYDPIKDEFVPPITPEQAELLRRFGDLKPNFDESELP